LIPENQTKLGALGLVLGPSNYGSKFNNFLCSRQWVSKSMNYDRKKISSLRGKRYLQQIFHFFVKYVEIVVQVVYIFEIENTPSSEYLILILNYVGL